PHAGGRARPPWRRRPGRAARPRPLGRRHPPHAGGALALGSGGKPARPLAQKSSVTHTADRPWACDDPGVATTLLIVDDHPSFRAEVVLVSSRDGSDYGPLVLDCGARGFIPKGELSGARLAALLA